MHNVFVNLVGLDTAICCVVVNAQEENLIIKNIFFFNSVNEVLIMVKNGLSWIDPIGKRKGCVSYTTKFPNSSKKIVVITFNLLNMFPKIL